MKSSDNFAYILIAALFCVIIIPVQLLWKFCTKERPAKETAKAKPAAQPAEKTVVDPAAQSAQKNAKKPAKKKASEVIEANELIVDPVALKAQADFDKKTPAPFKGKKNLAPGKAFDIAALNKQFTYH